jgi:uncharacterized membrane protein
MWPMGSHPALVHGTAEDIEAPPRARQLLTAALVPVVALTIAGLVVLWPEGERGGAARSLGFDTQLVNGTVADVEEVPCGGTAPEDGILCRSHQVRLTGGPDAGETISLEIPEGPSSVALREGDDIVLARTPDAPPELAYQFADYQRRSPLAALAVLFAVSVVLLGRWRGLRALAGLALSLLVLVGFVLPSILDGNNALAVAVVGASAIMLAALYLAHGFTARTSTAVLGTLASLGLTGVLALVFVAATRLTGLSSEEAVFLQLSAGQINLQGLILGGIIIGTLGVLDDVTVTQVSAVWELHLANPAFGVRELYRAAVRIGRDHIASTVNTLVLAYAGASLPLLILFVEVDRGLADVLTGEVVAIEVVRTLVGSIGLVASVPITTILAAVVITRSGAAPRGERHRRPEPVGASSGTWAPPRRELDWRDEEA